MKNNPIMIIIMASVAIYIGFSLVEQLTELTGYNGSMAASTFPLALGITALAAVIALLIGAFRGGKGG